jgi:hypothetical protein
LYPFIVLSKQTVSFCSKKLQRKALWKGPELQGKLVQTPSSKIVLGISASSPLIILKLKFKLSGLTLGLVDR